MRQHFNAILLQPCRNPLQQCEILKTPPRERNRLLPPALGELPDRGPRGFDDGLVERLGDSGNGAAAETVIRYLADQSLNIPLQNIINI